MEQLAWVTALSGFALGGLLAVVPGFPGCAVSLLGVVAFSGLTDFAILPREALPLAAVLTLVGALGQGIAPAVTSHAAGGAAGAATGAALGACIGMMAPLPGLGWLLAVAGAIVGGVVGQRPGWRAALRSMVGSAAGCVTGAVVDLLATLGLAALLALADFLRAVP